MLDIESVYAIVSTQTEGLIFTVIVQIIYHSKGNNCVVLKELAMNKNLKSEEN
jgi:hypothetical protein